MNTFRAVCELWGGGLAGDRALAQDTGNTYEAVNKWRQRDKIPAHQWQSVVAAAKKRGFRQVTFEALAKIASERAAA